MTRERTLRRKLDTLRVLGEAVNAMKSLSAHHLRAARAGLTAARAYQDGIDRVIASAGIVQVGSPAAAPAFLLIAADLGLCDGYSSRVTDTALEGHVRQARAIAVAQPQVRGDQQECRCCGQATRPGQCPRTQSRDQYRPDTLVRAVNPAAPTPQMPAPVGVASFGTTEESSFWRRVPRVTEWRPSEPHRSMS